MNIKTQRFNCGQQRTLGQRILREIRKNWQLHLLILVPLTYLIVFKYVPIYGVQIAFREYSAGTGLTGGEWVGPKYILKFLNSYNFKMVLWNTLSLSLYSLATFPLPILFALLLNYIKNQHFKKAVQLITYAPHFITTVVMVGMIQQFLDVRFGIVNILIELCGGQAQNFLINPDYFRHIYTWSGVWQSLGYSSIIYISALSGVSPELHEAAIVDGANIRQRIWHVDLPAILPTVSIMLIMRCGSILSVGHEKVFLMQNSLNARQSEIISTYVYKQGIASPLPQYSYSTAVNLFVSVINVILLLIANKLSDKFSGSSLF